MIEHRGPPPFKVETFSSGFYAVTNALGINWLSGCNGAVLFDNMAEAQAVADRLNTAPDVLGSRISLL